MCKGKGTQTILNSDSCGMSRELSPAPLRSPRCCRTSMKIGAGHVWERAVRVVNYSAFLKERQQTLTAFLYAALTMDPKVEDRDELSLELCNRCSVVLLMIWPWKLCG